MGFLFEFLEGSIFFKFLDVVGQVGFFLFDLFLFNRTGGRSGRGLFGMLGDYYELSSESSAFVIVLFCGFTAEHRRHIHLVQALLFAVPGA